MSFRSSYIEIADHFSILLFFLLTTIPKITKRGYTPSFYFWLLTIYSLLVDYALFKIYLISCDIFSCSVNKIPHIPINELLGQRLRFHESSVFLNDNFHDLHIFILSPSCELLMYFTLMFAAIIYERPPFHFIAVCVPSPTSVVGKSKNLLCIVCCNHSWPRTPLITLFSIFFSFFISTTVSLYLLSNQHSSEHSIRAHYRLMSSHIILTYKIKIKIISCLESAFTLAFVVTKNKNKRLSKKC